MTRLTATFLLVSLSVSCRPAGYSAPPLPPEPKLEAIPPEDPLNPEEFAHHALLGSDSAPTSIRRPPANARLTDGGVATIALRPGTGQRTPRDEDSVVIHFVGWDDNGAKFDSSLARGKPDRMRMDSLEPGWREGLRQMVVGEKRRMWIPERLAFGSVPAPGRPAGDIVLDVELLEIVEPVEAPKAPPDLLAPPLDALKTASGLRTKVLQPGKGERRPERTDRVLVHYSGWTTDGAMFDSSVARGEPIAFGVDEVIPGWTEALMLMVEGEHRRMWIPGNLAYGDTPSRPGAPAGALVFDVELIEIQR
jgi:peptidylprolyl isomerase